MRVFSTKKSIHIKDYKNARDIALFVLIDICENRRKSNTLLRETFREAQQNGTDLDATDKAFIERIVIGSLDRLISLDALLERFLTKSMRAQKPLIRAVLRLSLYQILYMDRVPDSAAVNEAVELVKLHGMEGMSGLVNGVLRSLVREKEAGGEKLDISSSPSLKYALPEWMIALFDAEYGGQTAERIYAAYLAERNETIRLNTTRAAERDIVESLMQEGFELRLIDMEALLKSSLYKNLPDGALPIMYEITGGGDVTRSEAFNKGYISVQDPASALVASFAAPSGGDTVIDVCAAPGGKSLAVLELADDKCRIEARDVSRQKTSLIEENVRRCGYNNISVRVLDALSEDEDSLYRADILLADLPCSGLGVIAKKPDIKLNLERFSITELKSLQRDILNNVSRFVKPKGRLIYSTCTLSREENEENTAYIEAELGFKKTAECKLLPGEHNDGFYIAVLQKKY